MAGGSAFVRSLRVPLRLTLLMYAWLTLFALIGGVLFERRLDIGLEDAHTPEWSEDDDGPDVGRLRDRQIDRIYAEWRGGAHANAWQTIVTLVNESGDPIAELRWLYARAARWPDQRLAERLARELLPRLLAQRAVGEALDRVRERLKSNARFRPASSAELLTLAQLARDAGDRATARRLLDDFSSFYPNDAALVMAERLQEQLGRGERMSRG